MFRNDRQICLALQVLLRTVGLKGLWTETGPTDQACELLQKKGGHLSSGERAVLLASFAIWNQDRTLAFAETGSLDRDRARALFELEIAWREGAEAVDQWIARWAEWLRSRT